MKRLGTRLGMLGGVVGLAAMAITQAQKDYSSTSQSLQLSESAEPMEPPKPIGADPSQWPAPPDTDVVRGNDGSVAPIASTAPSSMAGGVQLASHQESTDGGAAQAPSGFALPSSDPQTSAPDPSSDPSGGFSLPAALPPTATPDSIGTGVASSPAASENPAALAVPESVPSSPATTAVPSIQMPDEAFSGFGGESPTNAASAQIPPTNVGATDPLSLPASTGPSTSVTVTEGGAEAPPAPQGLTTPQVPNATTSQVDALTAPAFQMQNAAAASAPAATFGNPVAAAPQATASAGAATPADPSMRIANTDSSTTYGAAQSDLNAPAAVAAPGFDAAMVRAQPGNRALEGAQAPTVTIHKRAPEEVNVGKPATFAIQVSNTGASPAMNVVVHDAVPEGMELIEAVPQPQVQGSMLTWTLGDLDAGAERTITMTLLPHVEGELGSVASMSFQAAASVRTLSTRPELKIVQRAPEKVLIGQQVTVEIEISNPGTGTAYDVVLQEDVPQGLEHPKGRQLDNLLGNIEPGQSRVQQLVLNAVTPGVVNNIVQLTSEDEVVAKDALPIEVVSPQVQLELVGPTRRFLERRATYNVRISNTGTASATNIDVVAYLDRGLSFVSTEYKGQYDASRHAVFWSLAELPVGEVGEVPLVLLPVEPGEQVVRLESQADLGIEAKSEKPISVDTLAEITFSVNDDQDPIEVGATTTYAITVTNAGSREDTNVQLQVAIPPGLEFMESDQQSQVDSRGIVSFGALSQMSPQEEHTFRIRVRGRQQGTHILKAMITSDQSSVPVTKEESTLVYEDQ